MSNRFEYPILKVSGSSFDQVGDICVLTFWEMAEISQFMSAWQLRNYGGIDSLEFVTNLPIPKIKFANEVLVEVKAASLNFLDIRMAGETVMDWIENQNLNLLH